MPTIKVEKNVSLFYRDYGHGKPVVFVHGWVISSQSWDYLTDDICHAGFHCITYDQRGCGRSDQPWDGYDYDTLAGDLACLISELGLKEIILVGHSMGCAVITQYLAKYGESKVSKAVYLGTISPYPMPDADFSSGLIQLVKADTPAYVSSLADGFFGLSAEDNTVSEALRDWAIGLVLQASLRAAMEMTRLVFSNDQADALKRINIPVLLLHGDKDVSSPIESTAMLTRDLLKHGELKIYPGLTHGMYISKVPLFSQDLIAFIR